jgi:hypothetical protein
VGEDVEVAVGGRDVGEGGGTVGGSGWKGVRLACVVGCWITGGMADGWQAGRDRLSRMMTASSPVRRRWFGIGPIVITPHA